MILALCVIVPAEPVPTTVTEPTAAGTLSYTRVYWCPGVTCTDWRQVAHFQSDNGNGGDVKSFTFTVPLVQGTLPLTIRIRAAATDTSGNETAGAIITHTFTEP